MSQPATSPRSVLGDQLRDGEMDRAVKRPITRVVSGTGRGGNEPFLPGQVVALLQSAAFAETETSWRDTASHSRPASLQSHLSSQTKNPLNCQCCSSINVLVIVPQFGHIKVFFKGTPIIFFRREKWGLPIFWILIVLLNSFTSANCSYPAFLDALASLKTMFRIN